MEIKTVLQKLAGVCFFSFTTDTWSSDDGGASLLSLNYCSLDYSCLCKTIYCIACTTSHTGEDMAKNTWTCCLNERLNHDQVHLVLRDNAANMVKAMREDFLPFLGCFVHTL